MKIKMIDLFCGIGAFRLALGDSVKCVLSSDIDPQARETYKENFKDKPKGDIRGIKADEIPSFDLLCGGFPCQSFSSAGLQKGFNDDRGNLFFEILRIVKYHKPKVLFLENVSNLERHDGGNTLKVIVKSLEKEGYFVSHKTFNAKDFSLAQSRERIFIVASLNKKFDFSKVKKGKQKKIKSIFKKKRDYLDKSEYTIIEKEKWKEQKSGLIFCGYLNKTLRKNGVKNFDKNLSRVHRQPNRIYHIDGVNPTLSAQETAGRYYVYDGKGVSKISIEEAYKMQGFPASFKKNKIRTVAFKQAGNSIPVNVLKNIFKEIKKQLF